MFTQQQQKLFERKGGKESRYVEKWQKLVHILGILLVLLLALLGIGLSLFMFIYTNKAEKIIPSREDAQRKDTVIPIIQDVPRDAIPPLNSPEYESSLEAERWIQNDDIVLGVEFAGDARAYPVKIMNWHEIVNETIGGQKIVITYCPLCNSGIVFDRYLNEQLLSFGNTGALYESAMVMYDRETESYWYQITGEALTGSLKGQRLSILPSTMMLWEEWRALHKDTKVLSLDTGYTRNYLSDPYRAYRNPDSKPGFPVSIQDNRLLPKDQVVGITIDGISKAYPVKIVQGKVIRDIVSGQEFEIIGDIAGHSAQVFLIKDGEQISIPSSSTFWFAWFAGYKDTLIYEEE